MSRAAQRATDGASILAIAPPTYGFGLGETGMHWARRFIALATLPVAVLCLHVTPVVRAQTANIDDPVEIVPMTAGTGNYLGSVSFDASGRLAAIPTDSGAELWDIKKRRRVRTFSHPGMRAVGVVALSLDGSRIAAGGSGKEIVVWDTRTGRPTTSMDSLIATVSTLAFSKDGRRLIYGGSSKTGALKRSPAMVIREVETGRVLKTMNSTIHGLADLVTTYSPTTGLVAVGDSTGTVTLLDGDGRAIRTWKAHAAHIKSLAFSPDGAQLATSEWHALVKIWDVATARLLRTLAEHDSEHGVKALSWSRNGALLATLDSHNLRVWNVVSGALVATQPQNLKNVLLYSVAFAPDGASLLAGGVSGVLDAETLKAKSTTIGGQTGAVILPQGGSAGNDVPLVEFGDGANVSLHWLGLSSGTTRKLLSGLSIKGGNFLASKDAAHFAVTDTTSVLSYVDPLTTPPVKPVHENSEGFFLQAISANGKAIALGKDKTVRVVDLRSGTSIRDFRYGNYISLPVLSPDGDTLAVIQSPDLRGDLRYTLYLANTGTGRKRQVKMPPYTSPKPLVFAPDGRSLLIAGTSLYAYSVDHWSVEGPRLLARLRFPGEEERNKAEFRGGPIDYVAAFHPDGKSAVIGDDTVLRLWDLQHPSVTRVLRGHTSRVSKVAFVMGGQRIVSQAEDGLKVWNTATGELLATYLVGGPDDRIVITPEGFFDATEGAAKRLSIVRGLEVYSIDQVYQTLYRPDLVREKLAGDPKGKVKEAAARLDLGKVIASGGPPRVVIAAPKERARSDTDEIAVEVAVTDTGGGIGRIEWRVNGVTLGLEERGLTRIEGGAKDNTKAPLVVRRTLSLEPGKNRIEVVAYNARNLIASEPASVTVGWDGEVSVTPPKLHVLAVGVNEYWDSRLKLAYAVPDARALAAALTKAGSGLYGEGRVQVTTLTDAEVTIDALDKAFARIGKDVHPRDTFTLFVAGHGKTLNGRYYFLPYDFRYAGEESIEKAGIDQDRLQAWLAQVRARKTVLLFDTCESGSLTGDRLAVRGLERVAALEKMTRAMGRTVISASSDDAPALEGYKGHGAFTYVLLQALGAADINKNGLIEVGEIADYLEAKLPDLTFEAFKLRQVPHRKMVGNNFPLAGKLAALPTSVQPAPKATAEVARPTHVVTAATSVRATAGAEAAVVAELTPGMQVVLIEAAGGWALLERDGKRLGYVEEKALVRLQ